MKKLVVLALATVALAVPAAQAQAATSAAGPTMAQFKALQKQVASLQAQVKALQKWVPTSCTTQTCANLKQLTSAADGVFGVFVCNEAVIADEFQATWNVIDQISAATQTGKTYFGPQTSISDANACAAFKITRPAAIPPTTAIFSSIVTLLTG